MIPANDYFLFNNDQHLSKKKGRQFTKDFLYLEARVYIFPYI